MCTVYCVILCILCNEFFSNPKLPLRLFLFFFAVCGCNFLAAFLAAHDRAATWLTFELCLKLLMILLEVFLSLSVFGL